MSETASTDITPTPPPRKKLQVEDFTKRIESLEGLLPLAKQSGRKTEGFEKVINRLKRLKNIVTKIR